MTVRPEVLSGDECTLLRAEALREQSQPSLVVLPDGTTQLVEAARRSREVAPSEAAKQLLLDRLRPVAGAVARHYHVDAPFGIEEPRMVVYSTGDFFAPHADRSESTAACTTPERLVTVVLFLNSHKSEHNFYGGNLLFLQAGTTAPITVPAEPGTLVAFPATMIHVVTPVTMGVRVTVTSWLVA